MLDGNTTALNKYEAYMDKRDFDYSVILTQFKDNAKGIHGALGIVIDDLKNMMKEISYELETLGFDNSHETVEKVITDILGEDNDLVYVYEAVEPML